MSQPAGSTTGATPVADIAAAILPPTHPLLLLPIRIETALDGSTLMIRVYPDEIHLDRRPTADGGQPTARPRLLPDRFVATGWRDGARVFAATGSPVSEDALRVALDLGTDAPAAGLDWLWDFATAEQAGMALRVTLDQPRLDRLLVFGVRAGLDADATQAALTDLFGSRDDISFVAPGEATNQVAPATVTSTPAASTPTTAPTDTAPTTTPAPTAPTTATRLSAALGLAADGVASLAGRNGAGADEDAVAAAMHAALWPATWGYYLAHRLGGPGGPGLSPADLERGRRAFVDHVRAGGPLPTLRVGDQPYGFLPATTLDSWVGAGESLGAGVVDLLRRARPVWLAAASTLPQADGGPDDLLEVLRNSPSTAGISARTLMGPLYAANLLRYVGMPEWAGWLAQRDQLGTAELRGIGLGWTPPASRSVFAPNDYPLREPFVADTSPGYLSWLGGVASGGSPTTGGGHLPPVITGGEATTASTGTVTTGGSATTAGGATTHGGTAATTGHLGSIEVSSTHLAPATASTGSVSTSATSPAADDLSPTATTGASTTEPTGPTGPMPMIFNPGPQPTALLDAIARHALGRARANASGQPAPEGELLGFGFPGQEPLALTQASSPELTELTTALAILGAHTPDVLARHFTGALDLAAHRIDAWITAVAAERLATLRATTAEGLRVGAFGWVEGLQPRSTGPQSEGWIAAPSLAHATTAAVLRNGYRARRLAGEAPGTLAVDLSSRRVRRALRLLDEVRSGRTLGAVLGEQLERGLHDARLDAMIERFRGYAPVSGGGTTDGLTVAQRWIDAKDLAGFDFGGDRATTASLLDALAETLDAVADLTLAEGVHQLVTGNPVRAGALFDALGRGEQPPPEITVATTPRRSVHHTVRLLVALPADAARTAGDWPAAPGSVRAAAEPRADAWAARLLGPATAAGFTVTWTDGAGHATAVSGTLADTDLAPLDIVALASNPAELDGWLIRAVAASAPSGSSAPADPAASSDLVAAVTARPDAVIELAATLRRVLVGARAATAADLDPDATGPVPETPDPAADARAAAAATALDTAISGAVSALALTDGSAADRIHDALVALARFGIPQSLPAPEEPADAVRDRLGQALDVARRRAAAATAATGAAAVLSALFDEPFPVFGPLATADIPQRDTPDPTTVIGWLDRLGRVRAGVGALSDLLLYDESLGRTPAFALAQLPHDPAEPTLIDAAAGLADPRHVTVLHLPQGGPLPAQAAALLVDGWVEPVPKATETAGLTFHLERPNSQPPQACLIAVPPDPAAPWSTATLESVLLETLDAAHMRAVPAEALIGAAQLLPALQFAANTAGETVSTSFAPWAVS